MGDFKTNLGVTAVDVPSFGIGMVDEMAPSNSMVENRNCFIWFSVCLGGMTSCFGPFGL